jgi:ATP-binding cassette, subfamily C (CFTR/MRP), member 1
MLPVGLSMDHISTYSTAAHSTAVVLSACLLPLAVLEHWRTFKTPILLSVYLLLSGLLDIAQTRTKWLIATETGQHSTLARLQTVTVAVKFVWLATEHLAKPISVEHSLEERTGPFGLVSFTWLNPLFLQGYSNVLSLKDLAKLDRHLSSELLHQQLSARFSPSRSDLSSQNFGLSKALIRALLLPLLLPILPRLALVGFRICQPFLIYALLHHMDKDTERNEAWKNNGYGFIGAAIFIYFGVAVSTAVYSYFQERFRPRVRGALIAAIYEALTQLQTTEVSDAAAVTLMSTDIERIMVGFLNMHDFWGTPIEAALASWLLYRQIGLAFIAPLLLVICSVVSSSILNRLIKPRQKRWMDRIETRVSATAYMLANIKQLKMSGLSQPVEDSTQQLRVEEMAAATKFRRLYVANMIFGFAPMAICPLITFAVAGRYLDTRDIYTSLAFLVLLADPLGYLFGEVPYFVAAFTSLGRIQGFLAKEPRADPRSFGRASPRSSESITQLQHRSGPGITLRNVTVGWFKKNIVFRDISIDIPPACLTIIVGSVGSGKSTLCKTLLAEVPLLDGIIEISGSEGGFESAFCDQVPHMYNSTIRDNITGSDAFDEVRYKEVLEAAALAQDLRALPQGDGSVVGSSGMAISGGQKQRISIARALYHNARFNVLDDAFSGLDADTELEVFTRTLAPGGILARRGATVVLATHNLKLLPMAQHIIVLGGEGIVQYQGNYQELRASGVIQNIGQSLNLASSEATLSNDVQGSDPITTTTETPIESTINTSFLSDRDRMSGNSAVYRYYLASLGKVSAAAFLLFGLGWGFFYNFGYIWLRFWSNDTAGSHPRAFYIGLYALWQGAGLSSIVLCFWTSYTMMAAISGLSLHKSALQSVINAPLYFSTTTDVGIITNLFSQDMTLVDNELPMAITNLALDICNALGLAAVIATSSPYLAISYPILLGTLYLVQKVYLRTSRQIRLLDLEAKSPL